MEKSKISINVEGGFLFCGGWNFFKSVSVGSTFVSEMKLIKHQLPMILLSRRCAKIRKICLFHKNHSCHCTGSIDKIIPVSIALIPTLSVGCTEIIFSSWSMINDFLFPLPHNFETHEIFDLYHSILRVPFG